MAAVVLLFAAGCGGGSADGLDHQNVYGSVTLDGAPLPSGLISFDPAEGTAGGVSAGGVITDGKYNIPGDQGPTPGTYRVSIRSAGADDEGFDPNAAPGEAPKRKTVKDPIPAQYNTKSTLTAEVKAQATQADFELKSK